MSWAKWALVLGVGLLLAGPASAVSIVNGDFSAGLTGWTVSGPVTESGGQAILEKDPDFPLATLEQAFTVPADALSLSFTYDITLIPSTALALDVFQAMLAPTGSAPGSGLFFMDLLGLQSYDPAEVSVVGDTVTLDVSGFVGQDVLLSFWLLGSQAADYELDVAIDDVALALAPAVVPEPLTLLALSAGVAGLGGYLRRRP